MAIPRPKILTAITIPTGGWVWKIYLSNAGSYDTALSATMAAGTYFMAGDNQTTDFLYELNNKMQIQIDASALTAFELVIDIHPTTHKVRIHFKDATGANNDVKLAWTESDGDDIGKVLGFDHSADDTSTTTDNPTFTADWQHAYGWYADEDGLLESLDNQDSHTWRGLQARSLSGAVKTQRIAASLRGNRLALQFVTAKKMLDRGSTYAAAPTYPNDRNEPLGLWWVAAMDGTHFRIYRDAYVLAARGEVGTADSSNTTTLTDADKAFVITDADQWADRILHMPEFGATSGGGPITQSWYIASHTATVLTVTAHPSGLNITNNTNTYYLFDHPYQTYVIDFDKTTEFSPEEIPAIDRYNVEVPLLRYV